MDREIKRDEPNKLGRKCDGDEQEEHLDSTAAITDEGLLVGWPREPLAGDSAAELAQSGGESLRSGSIIAGPSGEDLAGTSLPDGLAGKIQIGAPAQAAGSYVRPAQHSQRGLSQAGHDLDTERLAHSYSRARGAPEPGSANSEVGADITIINVNVGSSLTAEPATEGAALRAQAPAPSGLEIVRLGCSLGAEGFATASAGNEGVEFGARSDLNSASRAPDSIESGRDGANITLGQPAEFKDAREPPRRASGEPGNELAKLPTGNEADKLVSQRFVESNDLEPAGSSGKPDCGVREGCDGDGDGASSEDPTESCWRVMQSCVEAVSLSLEALAGVGRKSGELLIQPHTFTDGSGSAASLAIEESQDNNSADEHDNKSSKNNNCALNEASPSHLTADSTSGCIRGSSTLSGLEAERQSARSGIGQSTLRAPTRRFSSEQEVFRVTRAGDKQLQQSLSGARKSSAPTTTLRPAPDRPVWEQLEQTEGSSAGNNYQALSQKQQAGSQPSISESSASNEHHSSQSSRTYKTAPLSFASKSSSSANLDVATLSGGGSSISQYETAKSRLTSNELIAQSTSDNTISEMVSFSMEDPARLRPLAGLRASPAQGGAGGSPETGSPTITPNTEELDDSVADVLADAMLCEQQGQHKQQQAKRAPKGLPSRAAELPGSSFAATEQPSEGMQTSQAMMSSSDEQDIMDEDQLRRILNCKRLSEGCNKFSSSFIRKNSLIMVDELPPLTEGEPMKHMSCHMSQNTIEHSAASSGSSGSLRQGGRPLGSLAMKRGSQDENTTSCSSSTSLERSPTRRRSSTVSQCSSVLSEGTRNQLNFDLSPDLPPDSSLLEANCISPTDFQDERPASPEPSSFSGEPFDFRPRSRVSDSIPEDELLQLNLSPQSGADSKDSSELAGYQSPDGHMRASLMERSPRTWSPADKFSENNESNADQPMAISADEPSSSARPASRNQRTASVGSRSDSPSGRSNASMLPRLIGSSSTSQNQRASSGTPDSARHAQTISQRSSTRTSPSASPVGSEVASNSSKRQHWMADSTCSSSSHSSRSSGSQPGCTDKGRDKKTIKDERIALNVIALERKDLLRKSPVSPRFGLSPNNNIREPYKRQPVVCQHQHSSSSTGQPAMCYCHQH